MKKKSILVVDDDEAIRLCLKDFFEYEGFLVTEAVDGYEAERCIAQQQPDYLLLDIFMPEKDGIEMMLSLKKSEIYIVAMSGSPDYLDAAKKLGADATVQKPFDLLSLKKLISDL